MRHGRGNRRRVSASYLPIYTPNVGSLVTKIIQILTQALCLFWHESLYRLQYGLKGHWYGQKNQWLWAQMLENVTGTTLVSMTPKKPNNWAVLEENRSNLITYLLYPETLKWSNMPPLPIMMKIFVRQLSDCQKFSRVCQIWQILQILQYLIILYLKFLENEAALSWN